MHLVRAPNAEAFAGRYVLERLLHRGTMSSVYRARDPLFQDVVIVKLVEEILEHAVARAQREQSVLERLRHPRIVRLRTGGVADRVHYMVFEYLEGSNLSEVLGAQDHLPLDEAAALMEQVLESLEVVHRAGLVHRDVKPSNFMLVPSKGVVMIDFGLAAIYAPRGRYQRLTKPDHFLGTALYASPECDFADNLDPRRDIYSCGVMLYECLAGRPPFEDIDVPSVRFAHRHNPPPPLSEIVPGLSPALVAVVERSLAKQPNGRYPTAAAMASALRAARTSK